MYIHITCIVDPVQVRECLQQISPQSRAILNFSLVQKEKSLGHIGAYYISRETLLLRAHHSAHTTPLSPIFKNTVKGVRAHIYCSFLPLGSISLISYGNVYLVLTHYREGNSCSSRPQTSAQIMCTLWMHSSKSKQSHDQSIISI